MTLAKITEVHASNYGVYGARKTWRCLARADYPVARQIEHIGSTSVPGLSHTILSQGRHARSGNPQGSVSVFHLFSIYSVKSEGRGVISAIRSSRSWARAFESRSGCVNAKMLRLMLNHGT